jgi:AmmeMemoRadiSam system protein B
MKRDFLEHSSLKFNNGENLMKLKPTISILMIFFLLHCNQLSEQKEEVVSIRYPVDSIAFPYTTLQMDSLMNRIDREFSRERDNIFHIRNVQANTIWKIVICPHDDYSYAGDIYPYILQNLSVPIVIILGVAHKASKFSIADKLIMDSFNYWKGPYGNISVSKMREEIIAELPPEYLQINDSLQQLEHSIEALLPFLQYYQPNVEIVSILVPYMNFQRMEKISSTLAKAIRNISARYQWTWGKDFTFAISNDCVHYGDQGWRGRDFAKFGADTAGFRSATNFDMNIISECLIDQLDPQRIRRFYQYTVQQDNYKEYAWTWCGRYSVPFGLLTAFHLQKLTKRSSLEGIMLRYSTSISHRGISVDDLGMGVTNPANIHHWVGYVGIGYRDSF